VTAEWEEGKATIYGKEQSRWYFSPHAHDHAIFLQAQGKSIEYLPDYEIMNALNPGKYGLEWVKKVVEGGRTAQVVTLEEALEIFRISAEVNKGDGDIVRYIETCICKRTRGGDVSEPICMYQVHRPNTGEKLPLPVNIGDQPLRGTRLRKKGDAESIRPYDPSDTENLREMLLDFERRLGLVHTVFTCGFPYIVTLCNCEMPYCHSMRQRFLYGIPEAFVEGYYVASVSNDKCTGCGKCAMQCQFGAIRLDRKLGKVTTMPSRCMGCGICRSVCPTDAIQMVERKQVTLLKQVEPVLLKKMFKEDGKEV